MGCSNPHPHGQAWSLSKVPSLPSTELASLKEYNSGEGHRYPASGAPRGPQGRQCLLCDYIHFERTVPRNEGRIVLSNDHWAALVPYWGVWPFEIMRMFPSDVIHPVLKMF
jgi:UDPglucose--hexose-1-phosphate uridylyltransferase